MDSDVTCNGTKLGNHPYGFTSFSYDLTPVLKYGAKNVLAVQLNVVHPCCRWYSGAGLYPSRRYFYNLLIRWKSLGRSPDPGLT